MKVGKAMSFAQIDAKKRRGAGSSAISSINEHTVYFIWGFIFENRLFFEGQKIH